MPQTVGDVIRRALGKLGVDVDEGVQADDMAKGLEVMQDLFDEMVDEGTFGRLTNVIADADVTAKEGQRILAADGVTVTLPDTIEIEDEDYDERPPKALTAIVVVQEGVEQRSLYNPSTAAWVRIDELAAADAFPLPGLVNGFAAILAVELAPDFGGLAALSPDTAPQAARARGRLSRRLGVASEPAAVNYF